ncbi:hypothetical protein Tco_0746293 [Tanacetum coccineum]
MNIFKMILRVTTAQLQLLEGLMLSEMRSKTYQRRDKDTSHIPRYPLEKPKEITTTWDDLLKKSNPVDAAKDLMDIAVDTLTIPSRHTSSSLHKITITSPTLLCNLGSLQTLNQKDRCKRSHGDPDHDHHEGEKVKKQKTCGQPKDVKIEDNHMDMDLDSGKDAWFDELLNSVPNLEEGEIPPNRLMIDFLRQMKECDKFTRKVVGYNKDALYVIHHWPELRRGFYRYKMHFPNKGKLYSESKIKELVEVKELNWSGYNFLVRFEVVIEDAGIQESYIANENWIVVDVVKYGEMKMACELKLKFKEQTRRLESYFGGRPRSPDLM